MLSVLTLSIMVSASAASGSSSLENDPQWEKFSSWSKQFKRSYKSEDSLVKAFKTWKANFELVEQINLSDLSWSATIDNNFADMSSEEFAHTYLLKSKLDVAKYQSTVAKTNLLAANATSVGFARPLSKTNKRTSGIIYMTRIGIMCLDQWQCPSIYILPRYIFIFLM